MAKIQLPASMIPSWRTQMALEKSCSNNILFHTWGGLGDTVCAEPAIRYALKTFKNCNISLATEFPELFTHLDFKSVYNLRIDVPFWNDYLVFNTIQPCDHLTWEFMSHLYVNCVDYCSLCAYRTQIPIADRKLVVPEPGLDEISHSIKMFGDSISSPSSRHVFIHAGKHWPSKTFPQDWWESVVDIMIKKDLTPVLIGKTIADHQGVVEITNKDCINLVDQTTLGETIWLLKKAKILICNDSAPLHLAASGDAWIGFIATCKHPDFISHWRKGGWAWKMENLGLGGMWDLMDVCPNKAETTKVDEIDIDTLNSFLPWPSSVVDWCLEKI